MQLHLFVLLASSIELQGLLSSALRAADSPAVTPTDLWSSNKSCSNQMYMLLVVLQTAKINRELQRFLLISMVEHQLVIFSFEFNTLL